MQPTAERPRPLSPSEAANRMGICVVTARRWCAQGIWGHKIRGRWYIEPIELDALRGFAGSGSKGDACAC
jgi:Helix-turn-helix domain